MINEVLYCERLLYLDGRRGSSPTTRSRWKAERHTSAQTSRVASSPVPPIEWLGELNDEGPRGSHLLLHRLGQVVFDVAPVVDLATLDERPSTEGRAARWDAHGRRFQRPLVSSRREAQDHLLDGARRERGRHWQSAAT